MNKVFGENRNKFAKKKENVPVYTLYFLFIFSILTEHKNYHDFQ
jgi:hypothetical protein